MDRIVPVSELRATLSSVTKWVESEKQPVILTKNGRGRFVLLDMDSYNDLVEAAESGRAAQDAASMPAATSAEAYKTAENDAAALAATGRASDRRGSAFASESHSENASASETRLDNIFTPASQRHAQPAATSSPLGKAVVAATAAAAAPVASASGAIASDAGSPEPIEEAQQQLDMPETTLSPSLAEEEERIMRELGLL